jgi:nucleoside-diphosphate-sugar epimerase
VGGTLNVLIASRDGGVKRVVFASSSSVYGNQGNPEGTQLEERDKPLDKSQGLPSKKEDLTPEPLSPYAITKLAGEHYCGVFNQIYGLETVMLRYFNIFGPRQDPASQYAAVIPRFILAMLDGRAPTIFGSGEQCRDFTFIENVIQANLKACEKKECEGQAINIGCGLSYSINELAEKIKELLHTEIQPVHDEPRKGDVMYSLADITRAKELLGYRPEVDFFEGLKRSVQWLKNDYPG